MTTEEQVQYDSILKNMSVTELKAAIVENINSTDDLTKLYGFCLNAALTFAKKAKL